MLRNDLATALDAMNDFKQAEELVHKSIAIAESLTEQDVSEELAIFYLNLGIILYHQGGLHRFKLRCDMKRYFQEALLMP